MNEMEEPNPIWDEDFGTQDAKKMFDLTRVINREIKRPEGSETLPKSY